jgi:hypothetical protein
LPYLAVVLIYGCAVAGCVVLVLHGHPWFAALVLLSGAGAQLTSTR